MERRDEQPHSGWRLSVRPMSICCEVFLACFHIIALLLNYWTLFKTNTREYCTANVTLVSVLCLKRLAWSWSWPTVRDSWRSKKMTAGFFVHAAVLAFLVYEGSSAAMALYNMSQTPEAALLLLTSLIHIFIYPTFLAPLPSASEESSSSSGSSSSIAPSAGLSGLATPGAGMSINARAEVTLGGFRRACVCFLYDIADVCWFVCLSPLVFMKEQGKQFSVFEQQSMSVATLVMTATLHLSIFTLLRNNEDQRNNDYMELAARLGAWKAISKSPVSSPSNWSRSQSWDRDSVVKYKKRIYQSLDDNNTAEPGNFTSHLFWVLFRYPSRTVGVVIILQALALVFEVSFLLLNHQWHVAVSWGVLIVLTFVAIIFSTTLRRSLLARQAKRKKDD